MPSKPSQAGLTVLRRRQVEARTGLGRSSIYALIARDQFPAPIRLSVNTVGWLEHEIDRWIAARIDERGLTCKKVTAR